MIISEEIEEEKKKVPIDQQLDAIKETVLQVRKDLLNALEQGFKELKKILTSETW